MRYNVFVKTRTNANEPHIHLRNAGIKPSKVERVFRETLLDEYERLNRAMVGDDWAEMSGHGTIEALDVTGRVKLSDGTVLVSRIYAEEV